MMILHLFQNKHAVRPSRYHCETDTVSAGAIPVISRRLVTSRVSHVVVPIRQ